MQHLRHGLLWKRGLPATSLCLVIVVASALGYASLGFFGRAPQGSAAAEPSKSTAMTMHTGIGPAGMHSSVQGLSKAPVYSAQQLQRMRSGVDALQNLGRAPVGPIAKVPAVSPAARGPSVPRASRASTATSSASSLINDTDLVINQSNTVSAGVCAGDCNVSDVMEPSIAMDGKYMFMTGNWFATYSVNGGANWSSADPYTEFPIANEFFCCDQQMLYEPSRDRFFWESLWLGNTSSDPNSLVLANLPGNLSGVCYYDWTPSYFGLPNTYLLDYPAIAVSTGYLYLTFNVYTSDALGAPWAATYVSRMPLTVQANCGKVSYQYFSTTQNFSIALATGGQGNMWMDSNWYTSSSGTGNSVRLWHWGDGPSASPVQLDVAIGAWPFITSTANCGSQDGVVTNWCTRLDSRRGSLYLTRANYRGFGVLSLGMAWSAAGGSYPFPFIQRVYINVAGAISYVGEEALWASWGSFAYPSLTVNYRGFIGGSFAWGGGCNGCTDYYPGTAIMIDDPTNPTPPWAVYYAYYGAANASAWGDYNTTEAFAPNGYQWVAGAWYVDNAGHVQPNEIIWGRGQDYNAYLRWSGV